LVGAEVVAVTGALLRTEYDILHSHWILPQGFAGMLAQALRPVPHVVTVHGGDVFGLRGRVMCTAKSVTLRSVNAVTTNSSVTQRAVLELAPELTNLHCIPFGVTISEPDPTQVALSHRIRGSYRRGRGPLLLFVGRVVEEKGVTDLLEALGIVLHELPDATAVIVGDGQDRSNMEKQAVSLALSSRVIFTGWVTPDQVGAYYAAADIFISASRQAPDGWIEAQGLTVLEAMASKTPVVATNLGGVPDSVINEQTGLLVPERCPRQLAAAIRRLAAEPELAAAMSAHAYRWVQERFSRNMTAATFSKLFSGLLQTG